MKYRLLYALSFFGLLAGCMVMPSWAIEAQNLIVRNGLSRPIRFEINENVVPKETETFNIQARWEIQLKKFKIDLSDPGALRVRLNESDSKTIPCRTIFTTFSLHPDVAVIITQTDEDLECKTIDLNGSPSEAASSLQQSVILSRLALKS